MVVRPSGSGKDHHRGIDEFYISVLFIIIIHTHIYSVFNVWYYKYCKFNRMNCLQKVRCLDHVM